jgi:hypothetical protein
MTTPSAEALEAPVPVAKPAPLWEDFIDIFYAPSQVFARRANSNPWPFIIIVTVLLAVISIVTWPSIQPVVEPFTRRAMEKAAASNPRLTQDMIDTQVRMSMKVAPWMTLATPIVMLIAALVLWVVGKLFGSKASYTQTLTIVGYACITLVVAALVGGVQALLTDTTKLTNPNQLALNGARFVDPASVSPYVYGLLTSLDVFGIWRLVLIAIGVRVIGKTSAAAAWGVAGVAFLITLLFAIRNAITMAG